MKRQTKSKKSGYTLAEVTMGAVISTMVIGTAVAMFIAGASAWVKGAEMIDAETQSRQALRVISNELRSCMGAVVSTDGMTVTYRLPTRDADGVFLSPPTFDGVNRTISHVNGEIRLTAGAQTRVITRNVILTDPDNNNAAYRIFTAGAGQITRDITVKVVTRRIQQGQTFLGRKREVVYLRNIPRLTQ